MELMLANYQFARLGEWNICTAVGRLSLPEGEGLFRARWKRSGFEPLSSILSPCCKGRGGKGHETLGCRPDKDVPATH
ncbi:MAG: hypothetical protein DME90_05415 [Verrucomicrobia bacterium]|nr:MAG: hypothetical protein DME90_05415 [Verrucomicrobiota bacterium]